MHETFLQGSATVAAAGTPVRLSSTPTALRAVEFTACKADLTDNAGNIYLGFKPTAGTLLKRMKPDDQWPLGPSGNRLIDLSEMYVDAATNGDGVTWSGISA